MNRPAQVFIATALALAAFLAAGEDKPDKSLQVHNPKLKIQWVSPDTRVAPFDKVMLAPLETDYRQVPPLTGPAT